MSAAAPASVTAPPGEALDRAMLENLRALDPAGGDAVLLCVLDAYLRTSRGLVDAIRSAADAGNIEALGKAAHSLKSSSLNVGAVRLGTVCREIEAAARARPSTIPAAHVAAIGPEYLRVEALLRAEIGNGA